MSAGKNVLQVEKGASFRRRFTYKDGDGLPIDISDVVDIQMEIREAESTPVLLRASKLSGEFEWETDGTDGVFLLAFTPTQTLSVETSSKLLYDILLVRSETDVTRIVQGTAMFLAAITQPTFTP